MTSARFGTLPDSRTVEAIELRSDGLQARILTLGAALQDLRLDGVAHSLTLGSGHLGAYLGPMRFCGTIVGPVANRIGGARATVADRQIRLQANDGANCLHSGDDGLHAQLWQVEAQSTASVTLGCALPDGLGGFPGNRKVTAHWALDGATLTLRIHALSDAPTLMNPASHSLWTLTGAPELTGHVLWVDAARYLPTDRDTLPVAAPAPVAGRFDLRAGRALEAGVVFDHNWCLADAPRPLATAARLQGGGLEMVLETTAPGLQVYTGDGVTSGAFTGHDGQPVGSRAGVALEPQCWPDAPGRAGFPTIRLDPGQCFEQGTRWTFRRL